MKLVDARQRFRPKAHEPDPAPAPKLEESPWRKEHLGTWAPPKQRAQVIVHHEKRVSSCLNCNHSLHDHYRDGSGKVHCNLCRGGGAFSCEGSKIHPNKHNEPAMYDAHIKALAAELRVRINAEVDDTDVMPSPSAACRRLDGRLVNVLREFALKYTATASFDSIKVQTTASAGNIVAIEWADSEANPANIPWLTFLRSLPKSVP